MNSGHRTSEVLADLTLSVCYDKLPQEVIAKAKELILDSIACIIGGSRPEQGVKTIRLFSAMGGVPDVHIFGTHEQVPLLNGIYVNSYLATVLDFDDTYDGHPGSTVVPAALNLGELNKVSGKAFLEAVVAGYETGIRVSNGIKPTAERTKQVRGINTWQIFCATAVASKLLGLNLQEATHALSHAAIHASVPSLRKWGFIDGRIQWLKNNFGWTSYGGVLSAILAKEGFVADTTIFDGEDGFWIMASSDRCDYDAMRRPLDNYNMLLVHSKPYPACRHIHPTLDAVRAIIAETGVPPQSIQAIRVNTFYEVVENYEFLPTIPFDACFSAPYLIALLLHGIPPGLEWSNPEYIADERILNTARKVELIEWKEASDAYPLVKRELMSRVEIVTADAGIHEKTIRIPRGDPRSPMSWEELETKFHHTVDPILEADRAQKICAALQTIENCTDLSEFTKLLVP